MADTKMVRIDEEAHIMLEQLALMARPKATLQAMATQLIIDAWERTVSQPNPDVTVEQAQVVQ